MWCLSFLFLGYLLYRMAYQVLMTVATVEIVKDLHADSYGLIFGANLFAALGCQVPSTWGYTWIFNYV